MKNVTPINAAATRLLEEARELLALSELAGLEEPARRRLDELRNDPTVRSRLTYDECLTADVAAAPPLSREQRARLATILDSSRPVPPLEPRPRGSLGRIQTVVIGGYSYRFRHSSEADALEVGDAVNVPASEWYPARVAFVDSLESTYNGALGWKYVTRADPAQAGNTRG